MSKIFTDNYHARNVLQRMWQQCESEEFCGVTLIAGETEVLKIPAHRSVLSASSDYFKKMFMPPYKENAASEVNLPGTDGETLKSLVKYCYSGELEIRADIVQKLIVTADSLLLNAVVEACSDYFLGQLHPTNCLDIVQLAERHNFGSLLKGAKGFCLNHFVDIYKTDEFLDLNVELLGQLLASDDLCDQTEEHVFRSLIRWLKHDPLEREQYKDELFKFVRMPLMSPSYLMKRVEALCTSVVCQELYAKAIEWHSLPECIKLNANTVKPKKRIPQYLMAIAGRNHKLQILYLCPHYFKRMKWLEELEERKVFDVAIIDNDLFIVGGRTHDYVPLNTVICLNLRTMTKRDVKPMHTCRYGTSVAVLKRFLYVVGGDDGRSVEKYHGNNSLRSVEKYDVETNTWTLVKPMLYTRRFCSVAVLNEKLYAVGGDRSQRSAECYDPQENVWTKIASVGGVCRCLSVAGGTLYAVRSYMIYHAAIEMYDTERDKWIMLRQMSGDYINIDMAPMWPLNDKVMLLCDFSEVREYNHIKNEFQNECTEPFSCLSVKKVFFCCGELAVSRFDDDDDDVDDDSDSD